MSKPLQGGIAKAVYKGLKSAGMTSPLTLTKIAPGVRGATVSGGTNPASTPYAAQGYVDDYLLSEIDGVLVQTGDRRGYVFGSSIAGGVVPAPNDKLTSAGITYRIMSVGSDPANAVFICQMRGAATS